MLHGPLRAALVGAQHTGDRGELRFRALNHQNPSAGTALEATGAHEPARRSNELAPGLYIVHCTTAVWDLDKSSRELPAAPRSSLGLAHRTGHSREGLVCVLGALGRFPRSNAVNGAREVTTDSRRDDHAK